MKNLTEIVFILDRSGSMCGLEKDTIGGFNALIEKQKREPGDALISTVLFDDRIEVLHDRLSLSEIKPMTEHDYYVRGCTALLDAVGKSIDHIAALHRQTKEDCRPEKTLFIITTDGMENSSCQYTYDKVKEMIACQERVYNWEFLFLGANIDAAETAERFGIHRTHAADFHCDSAGTAINYRALSDTICQVRACGMVMPGWKDSIDEDFKSRKKKG